MSAEISAESKLSRAMLFVVLGSAALFFGAVSAIGYSAQLRSGAQQASPIQALVLLVTGALIDFIGASIMYEGKMWPTAFALKEMTAAEEKKIAALVKKAVS